jgi:hypothetical protein
MHLQYSIRRIGRPRNSSDGGIIINNKNNEGNGCIFCNLNNICKKYKLTHHSCCGILSSCQLLSLGENILCSPLLALQALYAVW